MILFESTPFMERATDILALVFAALLLGGFLVFAVYYVMRDVATQKAKNDYVRKLNEHDRSIIAYYDNIKVEPWRKKHDISKN